MMTWLRVMGKIFNIPPWSKGGRQNLADEEKTAFKMWHSQGHDLFLETSWAAWLCSLCSQAICTNWYKSPGKQGQMYCDSDCVVCAVRLSVQTGTSHLVNTVRYIVILIVKCQRLLAFFGFICKLSRKSSCFLLSPPVLLFQLVSLHSENKD